MYVTETEVQKHPPGSQEKKELSFFSQGCEKVGNKFILAVNLRRES